MEALFAIAIGALTAGGIRLLAEGRSFPVLLGATLLSHAVNLFLFSTGQLARSLPPIAGRLVTASSDPLPQALVLTAIVISFGMTAVVAALAVAARAEGGSDRVAEPETGRAETGRAEAGRLDPGRPDGAGP